MIEDNHLDWIGIQGEIAGISENGKGIQGNPHKLNTLRFFGFHLTDSKIGRYDQISSCRKIAVFKKAESSVF